jgi:hypothetical protein
MPFWLWVIVIAVASFALTLAAPKGADVAALGRSLHALNMLPLKPEAQPYRYFRNCRAAHAAGRYNIRRGDPSYRAALDADNDGLACEPYRGR